MSKYFVISFEIVFPILFFMMLGLLLSKIKLLSKQDFGKINSLVFKVFLPIKLFLEVYKSDFSTAFDLKVVAYAIITVMLAFLLAWFAASKISSVPKDFVVIAQGLSRSNYVLFGMAIAASMYPGQSIGIVSVLAAFVVPIFNITAVFIFEFYKNDGKFNLLKVGKGILKNNLVLGSVIGLLFMGLNIKIPDLILKPLTDAGAIATPLAVICVGAALSFGALKKYAKYISITAVGRLVICPLLFVTGAILFGIRGMGLAGIFLIFATPTATASYPMAKELGGNDELAGLIVAVNNIISLVTLFLWIAVLKGMNFI